MNSKYFHLGISLFCKVGINIFIVFYLAKKLDLENFGSFSLAFVFSALFISIFDYGFNLKSLTLAGKKLDEINQRFSAMISAKIIITIISLFGLTLFLSNNNYNLITNKTITILIASSIPISFGNFFLNCFKAIQNFKKESTGYLIQAALIFILILINEFTGKNDIIIYASIIGIARVVYFIYALIAYKTTFSLKIEPSLKKIFTSLKNTTPFAIHLILGSSIIYIDTFILSFLSSLNDVGLYQAGMRIIMATMLIAVIISDAFIPEISALKNNKEVSTKKIQKLFEFILFFALLTSVYVFSFKNTIIQLLFSDKFLVLNSFMFYILSIILLRYIGIVPGIILTSFNKQNIRANAVLLSIIISITLNCLLIPYLGIEGAFISSLFAHIMLNIIYLFKSFKIINYFTNSKNYLFTFIIITLNFFLVSFFSEDNLYNLGIVGLINLIVLFFYIKLGKFDEIFKSK